MGRIKNSVRDKEQDTQRKAIQRSPASGTGEGQRRVPGGQGVWAETGGRKRCFSGDRWDGVVVQRFGGLGIAQAAAYLLGCVRLSVTQWTVAHQASLSMEFFRQEYWRGLPCTSSRGSPWHRDQGCISCLAGGFFTTEPAGKPGIAHTQAVHRTEHYPCRSCSGSVREREAGQASRCWARRCLVNCVKKSLLQRKVLTVLVGM